MHAPQISVAQKLAPRWHHDWPVKRVIRSESVNPGTVQVLLGSQKLRSISNQEFAIRSGGRRCSGFIRVYLNVMFAFLAALRVFFRSRVDTSLEVLALRQQVAASNVNGRDPCSTAWIAFSGPACGGFGPDGRMCW
jgi:hypothetical protein